MDDPSVLFERGRERLVMGAQRVARAQASFLLAREAEMGHLHEWFAVQMDALRPAHAGANDKRPALFDRAKLRAFATGSLVECFGAEYAIFDGRRVPRIPNGDLLLISRVVSISGQKMDFEHPAYIVSEYDVPEDAWYWSAVDGMPYSVLMEIAMQPCGFLSAYLGSLHIFPQQEFYFRNLDGHASVLCAMDVRGRTISVRAEMVAHMSGDAIIVQRFTFVLSCGGRDFYRGESTFGYFTPQAMNNPGGVNDAPAPFFLAGQSQSIDVQGCVLPEGQMRLLDEIWMAPQGGRYQLGYVAGRKKIAASDWFFACHFYQDPVMPGSLGVEAVLQALRAYVLASDLGRELVAPRFVWPEMGALTWKYRGQVLPTHDELRVEAHIRSIERDGEGLSLLADAGLWAGRLQIYELRDAGLRVLQGGRR